MSTFSDWLNATTALDAQPIPSGERAALAWHRILDKPTSVAFKTAAGATLAAQTVRIEVDNRSSMDASPAGAGPMMTAIVFGIRGHGTLPDTDIKEGYRFILGGDSYRINDIILTIGEVQGVAVAVG